VNKEQRLAMIAAACRKVQGELPKHAPATSAFKAKLQKKARKTKKNATESKKSIKGLEAFEESFMYDDEKTINRVWRDSGVVDSYANTTRFDNEWN
jgi:hypothetical protein